MIRGEILKISARNHWKSFPVFTILFLVIYLVILSFSNDAPVGLTATLATLLLFIIVFTLPVIILHTDYYLRNRGKEYEILLDKMLVRERMRETTYMKSDIEQIIFYHCVSSYRGSFFYMHYNYARIDMKDGESIYLTSLLYPKTAEGIIKKHFAGIPYYKIGRQFCSTHTKSRHEEEAEDESGYVDTYGLFKDDDREYDSITEFKNTRKSELFSANRNTKIENKNINTNDTKKS